MDFQIKDPRKASLAKVSPTPNNGWPELVPLKRATRPDGSIRVWFTFQEVTYNYNDDKNLFVAVEYDTNRPFRFYKNSHGFESEKQLAETVFEIGSNR